MNIKEAADPPVKKVEVNGTILPYIEQGSGETIVFIHGAVSDFRTWREQFRAFSNDFRVISYSRRSHYPNHPATGDSEYTRDLHKSDLIEFLKALKLEKAHLVGHSYGAAIALPAALEQPKLVGSLILGEPSPFPELFDEEGKALLRAQKKGFNEALQQAQNGETEAAVREFLHTIVGIDAFGLLPAERRSVILENAHTLLPMLRRYYDSPLNCEQLSRIKVPALLITGELSPLVARLNNKIIDRCLPNSKIAVLKCASHGLQIENPEGFNQLVKNFLSVNKNTDRLAKYKHLYESIF
jgi:pimeloyl-ACP methyl ester carboxylesterase